MDTSNLVIAQYVKDIDRLHQNMIDAYDRWLYAILDSKVTDNEVMELWRDVKKTLEMYENKLYNLI